MSETLGAWELLSRLGQTELGETHLAQRGGRKAVVIRLNRELREDPSASEALEDEVALAAQLEHPAIATVIEQADANGVAFIALEYVDGIDLGRLLRAAGATGGWPLSIERAASLLHPVLDALSAAHALVPPLLHRNLAPENVLVTREGRVVLTGFGLGRARLRAGAGVQRAYVSPEQARGTATDARSEVFAAGLLLFELVCGRLPAQGGAGEVISRIAIGELDEPLTVNPALDANAAAVLRLALAQRPEERFPSTAEFAAALVPWLAGAKQEEPLGAWAARLSAVKLEQPPQVPSARPVPAPAVAAAAPAEVAVASAKPARKKSRRLVFAAAGALGSVVVALAVLAFPTPVPLGDPTDPSFVGRPLELTSDPTGAQVYVDGVAEERRTPLTLLIPKDEFRTVLLKKPGSGSWSGLIHNVRKLEVVLATGAVTEDRYEGQRPPAPKEPTPPTVAPAAPGPPATPPRAEVVFDAEEPPIEVVLTGAHSVKPDTGQVMVIPAGARVETLEGALVYNLPTASAYSGRRLAIRPAVQKGSPWVNPGSSRRLGLFALRVKAGDVRVFDLSREVVLTAGGEYHFFSPVEATERAMQQPSLSVNGVSTPLNPGNMLRVDPDDSFLVRVLSPKVTYQLVLKRADGKKGRLPVVLMSLTPDYSAPNDGGAMWFDGQPTTSGQALVGAGSHTLRGARSVWFTIVTAQGVVPPEVKLTLRPSAQQRQLPVEGLDVGEDPAVNPDR